MVSTIEENDACCLDYTSPPHKDAGKDITVGYRESHNMSRYKELLPPCHRNSEINTRNRTI